jgi:hypothetical protein
VDPSEAEWRSASAPSGLRKCRLSRPDTPGEVAYERAFDEIAALADALENQREADYAAYAERSTSAIEAKLGELTSSVPITVTITIAPDEDYEAYEAHRPPDYPADAIEAAIAAAIMDTPTPSAAAPGDPLQRLPQAH